MSDQTATPKAEKDPRRPAVSLVGVVDSISGAKSVRVVLNRLVKDPAYGKYRRRRSRLMAHDETGDAQLGDTVEIAQCRPISKRKTWRVVKVIRRSTVA